MVMLILVCNKFKFCYFLVVGACEFQLKWGGAQVGENATWEAWKRVDD